jgi:hypothetical protein
VIAYEEGFAEATVTEFSEDFVAVVEVVGCLHGGWFLVRMDYGVWVWVAGYYSTGLGLSGKGGGIFWGCVFRVPWLEGEGSIGAHPAVD